MKFSSTTGEIVTVKADQKDAWECYMKSCKIKSYSIKEDKNRASTSNINVVITNLDDLDPRANSEDWQPSRIEDVEPF